MYCQTLSGFQTVVLLTVVWNHNHECLISVLEMNVGPNPAFNTVVLVTLVQNHLSDYDSIRDEFRAKPFLPDRGPLNAGVESFECLTSVLRGECKARPCLQYCGPCNSSLESFE